MGMGELVVNALREKRIWGEGCKVYTRKIRKKVLKDNRTTTLTASDNIDTCTNNGHDTTILVESNSNSNNKNNEEIAVPRQSSHTLAADDLSRQQQTLPCLDVVYDDLLSNNRPPQVAAPNGCEPPNETVGAYLPFLTRLDNRVRINVAAARSKHEIRELKRKLLSEIDQVRGLVVKLKAEEVKLTGYSNGAGGADDTGGFSHFQYLTNSRRALVRVNSEVGSMGHHESRPFRQLSVSVMENNQGVCEFVEKEKRTPKANQYYRNSEFLLGKDRLPPAESNKKLKPNSRKKRGREMGYGFGLEKYIIQALKSCKNLVASLMKHEYGCIFNEPVDAPALGLLDYHAVIKHPMDLGTIKRRLEKNWYKSPREFAEDVRLTFSNAMTYNPKGHPVHVMAEELSKNFEDKWAAIQSEYIFDWRYEFVQDVGLPTPTSRKVHPLPPTLPHAFQKRTLEGADSISMPVDSKQKLNAPVRRTRVPKKPKANDPDKRDMTYEEKQRLSTKLQTLPSDKLDSIVQIIKKGNSALSQHDDEIEVDIDHVDAETLWELDRFVTNYKKSLSKNKRRTELALQARAEARPAVPAMNPGPVVVEPPKESKTDKKNGATSLPAQGERQGDNVSRSSSSSSSSSDSDSSSSDSDSDSSSAYGSDAGHPSRT